MPDLCALCGENPATTRDHIPPQGIYPKPRDNDINFNIVPACSSCNNGAAVEDEQFKVFIGISTGEFHDQPETVINSIARTIGNNQKIANQIFETKRNVYAYRQNQVLEPAVSVTFDGEKYCKVVSRIVRGLYWIERGKALGLGSNINIFPTDQMKPDFAKSIKELMDCLNPHLLNKKTFVYKVLFNDDGSSIWGIQFFGKHTVFAYAEPPKA
ncbi:HNH endonuclease [Marinobacter algicola]|uniref:HNH endonuclease 5 domain-containing protein n=1 Tax=Marinobacter algicola DG893 TaxID=443152 RepID=A6F2L4_9GAMM|nr:hypothetical protein [Marinobacter algicola]EDM46959.1 hypothetical protein MDG893_15997 [Marinobacter algicola DG893]